jgi:hypothetical protein
MPKPRIACTYAVPAENTALENNLLIFNAALPGWMKHLPDNYPLSALIKHENHKISNISGAKIINSIDAKASVIEFNPGKIEIQFSSLSK